jgi:hypothetical protein
MSLTGVTFVLAYLYGLLCAFAKHPRWGLFTYMAAFYLHPPYRWWGAGLPELRWSLIAAVVTFLAMPSAKLPPDTSPWSSHLIIKSMLLYVAWMWVQIGWGNPNHMEGVILMTKYVILAYLIYRLVNDEQGLRDFALFHVAGCFYFGVLALGADGAGRLEFIGGPGVNDSNTLGMHVSTGLLFAGTIILAQSGWRRWFALLSVPVLANCIVQTESRGAFLGAACGGLVYLYYAPKHYRKYITTLGVIGVFILLAYAPSAYWERMGTIRDVQDEEKIDSSAESRMVLVKAQLQMFLDNPFGLGFNTTAYLSRGYLDVEWLTADAGEDRATQGARSSHNTLMSVLVDQGIPGLLLAMVGGVGVLGALRQVNHFDANASGPRRELGLMRAAICASLMAIFVSGMFTNYLKAEVQLWMLALLVCLTQLVRRVELAGCVTTGKRNVDRNSNALLPDSSAR